MTLPCMPYENSSRSFPITLDWRKCAKPCHDTWMDIAAILINDPLHESIGDTHGNISISPSSGNLKIAHFLKANEGLYCCIWDHHGPYHVLLKQYGEYAKGIPCKWVYHNIYIYINVAKYVHMDCEYIIIFSTLRFHS